MKRLSIFLALALAGCAVADATNPVDPTAPTNLTYELTPSGDPNAPLGVLLTWSAPTNGAAMSFNVFGRSNGQGWILRATTTSPSFHDVGAPQSQYYVAALNEQGQEMGQSNTITIDLSNRLPAPLNLTSISLNGAIQLSWSDNAVQAGPSTFDHYRIYSASYDATRSSCVEPWYFEGTTVSDAFLVGNLTNGVTQCYAVSAISHDGHESTWSNARTDTPRLDARSVLVYAAESRADSAIFVFNDELANKFGIVAATTRLDADFVVNRQADGTTWITPARTGSLVRAYSGTSINDLSSIDRAPVSGFQSTAVQAQPGFGYVFRLDEANGTHFAALRVQFVTKDFIVFDWSYQTGVGNPELSAGRAIPP
jgi:hypothetical protein